MKRIKFLPDYTASKTEIAEQMDTLIQVFGNEYEVTTVEIDVQDPSGQAMNQVENLMCNEPDIIIACGLSCFFAINQCMESHCICISPKISPGEIPTELSEYYEMIRPSGQELDELRHKSNKQVWGVYATDDIKDDRLTMSYFYPHLMASDSTDITEKFIHKTILPIVELFKNYEWYDINGVHFSQYGRVIDCVQRDIFQGCKEYVIPNGVHNIKPGVFQYTNLEKIVIDDYLEEIPEGCFAGCSHLKSIEFELSSLWKISESAFRGCTALAGKLDLSRTMISVIEDDAFADTNFTAVELPNSIRHCSESAFPEGCKMILSRQKLHQLLSEG